MSKWITRVVVIVVIGSSFLLYPYLPEQLPNKFNNFGTPSSYTSTINVMFGLIISVITVYMSAIISSWVLQKKSQYRRFQQNVEKILMVVMLIVFAVYIGVVVNGLGYEVNILFLLPLCLAFIFIVTGNVIQQFKMNTDNVSPLNSAINESWNNIRFFLAKVLFVGGILMLPLIFLTPKVLLITFFIVLGMILLVMLLGSYAIYKKHNMPPTNKTI
ncbi:hypothetical protein [Bacillus sp. SM2101]|uniref:hypothetical protein n=1 Tax=Bacillaceae TaxID=186817 RepID=UPI001BDDDE6A|nr:hypothetical protein [Bacillus sp. SM2101]